MAMTVAVRGLKGLLPLIKEQPLHAFCGANSVYGLAYGFSNCSWSERPLIVERVGCGVAMALAHINPAACWWTTYWHLATIECRLRGRGEDVSSYQPLQFILDPTLSRVADDKHRVQAFATVGKERWR